MSALFHSLFRLINNSDFFIFTQSRIEQLHHHITEWLSNNCFEFSKSSSRKIQTFVQSVINYRIYSILIDQIQYSNFWFELTKTIDTPYALFDSHWIPWQIIISVCQKTPTPTRVLRRSAILSARFQPRSRRHRHH